MTAEHHRADGGAGAPAAASATFRAVRRPRGGADFAYYEARARRLRAETVGRALAAARRGVGRTAGRLAGAARRWQQARAAERELSALDDRMLCDIGLTRAEIGAAVRGKLKPSHREWAAPRLRRMAVADRTPAARPAERLEDDAA